MSVIDDLQDKLANYEESPRVCRRHIGRISMAFGGGQQSQATIKTRFVANVRAIKEVAFIVQRFGHFTSLLIGSSSAPELHLSDARRVASLRKRRLCRYCTVFLRRGQSSFRSASCLWSNTLRRHHALISTIS